MDMEIKIDPREQEFIKKWQEPLWALPDNDWLKRIQQTDSFITEAARTFRDNLSPNAKVCWFYQARVFQPPPQLPKRGALLHKLSFKHWRSQPQAEWVKLYKEQHRLIQSYWNQVIAPNKSIPASRRREIKNWLLLVQDFVDFLASQGILALKRQGDGELVKQFEKALTQRFLPITQEAMKKYKRFREEINAGLPWKLTCGGVKSIMGKLDLVLGPDDGKINKRVYGLTGRMTQYEKDVRSRPGDMRTLFIFPVFKRFVEGKLREEMLKERGFESNDDSEDGRRTVRMLSRYPNMPSLATLYRLRNKGVFKTDGQGLVVGKIPLAIKNIKEAMKKSGGGYYRHWFLALQKKFGLTPEVAKKRLQRYRKADSNLNFNRSQYSERRLQLIQKNYQASLKKRGRPPKTTKESKEQAP